MLGLYINAYEREGRQEGHMISPRTLSRVVFGIRYGPAYRVGDGIGTIVDEILRGPGTPFGPAVFPQSHSSQHKHTLFNPDNGDRLVVSERDLLLSMQPGLPSPEAVPALAALYQKHVLDIVLEVIQPQDAVRYGVLVELGKDLPRFDCPLSETWLPADRSDVDDYSVQFAQRYPARDGVLKKGVEDFVRTITTVRKPRGEDPTVTFDYQEYFEPALTLQQWKSKTFYSFAAAAVRHLEGTFFAWLDGVLKQIEAA